MDFLIHWVIYPLFIVAVGFGICWLVEHVL